QLHDLTRLSAGFADFRRLDDTEAVAVEEEGVLAENVVELPDRGMIVGYRLCLELAKRLLDEGGIQLHGTLPFDGIGGARPRRAAPPTERWSHLRSSRRLSRMATPMVRSRLVKRLKRMRVGKAKRACAFLAEAPRARVE